MTPKLILPLAGLAALPAMAKTPQKSAEPKRANIILFLIDDQGWYESPLRMLPDMENSNSQIMTHMPNFMRFAGQSSRFSQAYSAAPISGPSRASIQTGKSLCRSHYLELTNWEQPSPKRRLIAPTPEFSMPEQEVTIAEMLKKIDPAYATAHFGKWHCDERYMPGPVPKDYQGYDRHDGEYGNSGPAYFNGQNPKDIYGITDRAVKFMTDEVAAGRPFYMQVSHYALHNPPIARPETLAKYAGKGLSEEEQQWVAVAEELDRGFGMVWDKVKELGIEDNTYIVWMSDNGIPKPSIARRDDIPLRGVKLTLWEGGIRVPLLVSGPGIAKDRLVDVPVVGYDLFPTFCDMAGASGTLPEDVDGGSFLPVLQGKSDKVAGRGESMFFHYPYYRNKVQTPSSAIVRGEWKVMKSYETGEYMLFNLKNDIGETKNVAKANPKVLESMKKELDDFLTRTGALMPRPNPDYKEQTE